MLPRPDDIARALDWLEGNHQDDPQITVLLLTTRQARTLFFMRGALILEARRRPVLHRGRWIRVID